MGGKVTIGWKVASLDPNIASVRYRALLPSILLESEAIRSRRFSRSAIKNLQGIDLLVIVKSFTEEDVVLAEEAMRRSIPVVLDLCDNIFVPGYVGRSNVPPADNFVVMAKHAVAITASTETLAAEIVRRVGQQPRVFVIPDGLMSLGQEHGNGSFRWETFCEKGRSLLANVYPGKIVRKLVKSMPGPLLKSLLHKEARRQIKSRLIKLVYRRLNALRQKASLVRSCTEPLVVKEGLINSEFRVGTSQISSALRIDLLKNSINKAILKRQVPRSISAKQILWFGNHGASYSRFGMLELLTIRDALERIAVEMPAELWVVSNNREKYDSEIAPLAIPSHYVEWSPNAMKRVFAIADVVVLPSSGDSFSICKSANRAVLALTNNVPVVATLTPALEPLRGCVWLGDPYEGISAYLRDSGLVQEHLARGRLVIEQEFSGSVIARRWQEVIRMAGSI